MYLSMFGKRWNNNLDFICLEETFNAQIVWLVSFCLTFNTFGNY